VRTGLARAGLAVFFKSGLVMASKSVTLVGKRFPAHFMGRIY
jgi:hypothetical protein